MCRTIPRAALAAVLAGLAFAAAAPAQQQQGPGLPTPRLFVVTPPGGRAGTTVEVTFTGIDLDKPEKLLFDDAGFTAEPVAEATVAVDPKRPRQQQQQRRGQLGPDVSVKFKVTIPAGAALGNHDVRVVNKEGVSNPRTFVVGDLPEVLEKEPNNDVDQAQRVEVNSTINGIITTPTDVDYYVFAGKKGQRVVASCLATSIDSPLPAALELYGPGGKLLASNRDYQEGDAVLDSTLPDDGDYLVRVFAFTYTQGSPDHFYRLTISTAPWIDAVFPPVVEPGKPTRLEVYGRNLPGGQPDPSALVDGRPLEKVVVTWQAPKGPQVLQRLAYRGLVPPKSTGLDGCEFRLRNDVGNSNPFLLTYARAPVALDNGDNDTPESAQRVPAPCVIAGRIEKRRDRDWYAFTAKKGDTYSIEVFGDRLGAPEDLYFQLRNAATKQVLTEQDDNPDVMNPLQFMTRTEDPPRYRFTAPADGEYQLMVASREAFIQAGPRFLYTVRIAPEEPDFRLVVMPHLPNTPEACGVPRGGRTYCTVYVWRHDGFAGDVELTADGLPEGVTCAPQTVGREQQEGTLVLSAKDDAPLWAGVVHIKGTAVIHGRKVEREARAASVTWPVQQGVVPISRLDHALVLAVRDEAPYTLTADIDHATVLQGEKVEVPVTLKRHWPDFKVPVQVSALNLPSSQPGNRRQQQQQVLLTLNPGTDQGRAVLNISQNATPGRHTIVLRGQAPYAMNQKQQQQRQGLTIVEPSTPIVVTVLPKQLANVTLSSNNATVRAGKETEVVVKVNRLFEFEGEFKVELVLPPGTKGLHAAEATIPAGADEARLVLRADADAGTGNRGSATVRTTAVLYDKPVTQETKLNVNVVK
jgi:hypothetical protein